MKCTKCNIEKENSAFEKGRKQCKKCRNAYRAELGRSPQQKEYRKKHYKENKEQILAKAKEKYIEVSKELWRLKQQPCVDCGNIYHPVCMDFDHINEDKFKGVGNLKKHKKETLLEEINKCELVCANCHRIRTHLRKYEYKENPYKEFLQHWRGDV